MKNKKNSKQIVLLPNSTEYQIAVMQLERLKSIALDRLFTPDEAKIYDILVKNLNVSKESEPTDISSYKEIEQPTEQEMVKLAEKAEPLSVQDLIRQKNLNDSN